MAWQKVDNGYRTLARPRPLPREGYVAVEMRHVVQSLLWQMPDEDREVLEMYYFADMSLADIARVRGTEESLVWSQFCRAHAWVAEGLRAR